MNALAKPISVLLIEDNETDLFVITQILKNMGLDRQLEIASDGEAAFLLWDRFDEDPESPSPDLVLLDLSLPKVSGLDILKRIRSSRRCRNVPVVIVTSSESERDLESIRSLRASAYFRKPADLAKYLDLEVILLEVISRQTASPPRST